jgi:SM-20-related protein
MTHYLIEQFLDPRDAADLLEFATKHESLFEKAKVGGGSGTSSPARESLRLTEFGPFKENIERRVEHLAPSLIARLGLTPFMPIGFETELVAHTDGAFYKRHIDLFTSTHDRATVAGNRMISVVAYFHRQPRRFAGGALRLYPQVDPTKQADDGAIDLVPEHNTAIAFSSWLPHEVLPVDCPSSQFGDVRFAVNCWVLRAAAAA